VNDFKLLELSDLFMEFEDNGTALEKAIHEHAQQLIAAGDVTAALKAVLTFNPG
jgi:predicted phosphodiesterase